MIVSRFFLIDLIFCVFFTSIARAEPMTGSFETLPLFKKETSSAHIAMRAKAAWRHNDTAMLPQLDGHLSLAKMQALEEKNYEASILTVLQPSSDLDSLPNVQRDTYRLSTTETIETGDDLVREAVRSVQFVQVGTFGVERNAIQAAKKLDELGLPTKITLVTIADKKYEVVLAGPFRDQSAIRAALQSARSAGFRDAFLLK
jgi:hypothetical protein